MKIYSRFLFGLPAFQIDIRALLIENFCYSGDLWIDVHLPLFFRWLCCMHIFIFFPRLFIMHIFNFLSFHTNPRLTFKWLIQVSLPNWSPLWNSWRRFILERRVAFTWPPFLDFQFPSTLNKAPPHFKFLLYLFLIFFFLEIYSIE